MNDENNQFTNGQGVGAVLTLIIFFFICLFVILFLVTSIYRYLITGNNLSNQFIISEYSNTL